MKKLAWLYLVAVAVAAVYGFYLMYILDPRFFKCFALAVVVTAGIYLTMLAVSKVSSK